MDGKEVNLDRLGRLLERTHLCNEYQLDPILVKTKCKEWWEKSEFTKFREHEKAFLKLMKWAVYQEAVLRSGGRCRLVGINKNPDEEFRKRAAALRAKILNPLCNQANAEYRRVHAA
jgi:hypothetical protein